MKILNSIERCMSFFAPAEPVFGMCSVKMRVSFISVTSINQFFVVAIAEKLASMESERQRIVKRAERSNPKAVLAVLDRVKNREVAHVADRIHPPVRRK